jgi:hypothetical protein
MRLASAAFPFCLWAAVWATQPFSVRVVGTCQRGLTRKQLLLGLLTSSSAFASPDSFCQLHLWSMWADVWIRMTKGESGFMNFRLWTQGSMSQSPTFLKYFQEAQWPQTIRTQGRMSLGGPLHKEESEDRPLPVLLPIPGSCAQDMGSKAFTSQSRQACPECHLAFAQTFSATWDTFPCSGRLVLQGSTASSAQEGSWGWG